MAEKTQAEKDAALANRVREADIVILLTKAGQAGMAHFKHSRGTVPFEVEVNYGEKDDPPLTIRQVTVKAGWTREEWRKFDRSGLDAEEPTP